MMMMIWTEIKALVSKCKVHPKNNRTFESGRYSTPLEGYTWTARIRGSLFIAFAWIRMAKSTFKMQLWLLKVVSGQHALFHSGKPPLTKMDEFSENLQTASDPRFGKLCCAFFRKVLKSATKFFGLEWPPLFEKSSLFSLKITAKMSMANKECHSKNPQLFQSFNWG